MEAKADHGKEKGEDHKGEASVVYKLTGAGSALVETQFPGSSHEMVSVYHLDGEDLRMTHYCAVGNQPHVKLDRANSKPTIDLCLRRRNQPRSPEGPSHSRGQDHVSRRWQGHQRLGKLRRGKERFDRDVRDDTAALRHAHVDLLQGFTSLAGDRPVQILLASYLLGTRTNDSRKRIRRVGE